MRAAWRLAVVVTLARLLGPADFGLAAMALVLSAFVVPLADLGLGTALVQRRTLEERERSTVFWLSVAAGVGLSALGIALAGLVADFYGRHELQLLFAALSLSFVITSLGTVQRSELVRKMDFRALELRTIAGVMVGGVVAIVLASLGYGAWALIGQELAIAAVSTCLLWLLIPWRPRFLFSGRSARELGGYGLSVLGGSFFVGLNQNADNLIVGRFLGASALGLYSVAYSVILAPLTRIVDPAQQVLFSALARIQDDRNHVVRAWKRMVRLLAVICMPMMLGFVVVAPDVVPAVLGSRWTDAVPVFQILACVSVVQCLQRPVAAILQAVNLPRMYLVLSAAGFVFNLAAFFVGLRWGVVGVAGAFAVTQHARRARLLPRGRPRAGRLGSVDSPQRVGCRAGVHRDGRAGVRRAAAAPGRARLGRRARADRRDHRDLRVWRPLRLARTGGCSRAQADRRPDQGTSPANRSQLAGGGSVTGSKASAHRVRVSISTHLKIRIVSARHPLSTARLEAASVGE